jgi:hypothetical protein
MPGFQFELSQLVNVPGKDQQGRISGRTEFVAGTSIYMVTWLDESMDRDVAHFGEAELLEAQKKKPDSTMTVKIEADTSDLDNLDKRLKDTKEAATGLSDTLAKLPRNVFNTTRKRSRSKRRSKR